MKKRAGDEPHYIDHRKRLRERFRKAGFEGFRDYEALELLLTYAVPRKDVKPISKELIVRFGGFQGVLDAAYEELVSVAGIKENAATFLLAVKQCAALYLKEGILRKKQITSTSSLLDYCRVAMSGLRDEQFRVVFLNSQNEVIADEVIQEGTVNHSVVYPRKVMERALYHKASSLIFVHNHPGGGCKPSSEDKRLTNQLMGIAMGLGIKVLDHMIISKSGHFSFLEKGLL
ncbi:MAG: DNA repair protein RadC [Thermodesulfovibrionales bacterium]|nr:DNA repair protein RadC [Thermodesulfovibrionales bacterium]